VLEPYSSLAAESAGGGGWPPSCRGKKQDWYGLALRPRVIIYNTKSITENPPRQLEDLAPARFAARGVGIADPAFGTTRGYIAVLYAMLGDKEFARQLGAVKWRVYDGNAAVVRAVANGEVDVGLADFDDFVGAEKNAWPVGVSFPTLTAHREDVGIVATPGTVALVKGAPHDSDARRLIDFILSRTVQEELASGPWRSIPVLHGLPPADERLRRLPLAPVQWELVAGALQESGVAWKKAVSGK
jgi:iron(III) transport system substrate-binding protein